METWPSAMMASTPRREPRPHRLRKRFSRTMAGPQGGQKRRPGSIRFRFRKAGGQTSLFPDTAGLEELDALAALKDAALGADGAGGLEAAML